METAMLRKFTVTDSRAKGATRADYKTALPGILVRCYCCGDLEESALVDAVLVYIFPASISETTIAKTICIFLKNQAEYLDAISVRTRTEGKFHLCHDCIYEFSR